MIKKILKVSVGALLFLSAFGCSERYREAELGISGDEVLERLLEVQSVSASSQFSQLAENSQSVIYFAEAPGSLGSTTSVLSLFDLSLLGHSGLLPQDLSFVEVFFLDGFDSQDQRQFSLLIRFQLLDSDQVETVSFDSVSGASFSEELFRAELRSSASGESVFVESFDLDENISGELGPVIQLKLFTTGSGQELYAGKINSLVGFSN